MKWLYYLHTNGDLISKNPIVLEGDSNYFDSDFVRTWWTIDTEDRGTLYPMIFTALAMEANKQRISELAVKWGMTQQDTYEFLIRFKPKSDAHRDGLRIFITDILQITEDEFYDGLKQYME